MLFLLALSVAVAHAGQTLAGPAFERFARAADQACPAQVLRLISPGDLSWLQESFAAQLSPVRAARLNGAGDQDRRCATSEGGLSCPTNATLDALHRTAMLPAFTRFACTHAAPGAPHGSARQAAAILHDLDLGSFPNSTGPRRQAGLYTPADYGFTSAEAFDDGWAQLSAPADHWHMSALLLDGGAGKATICFVDAGGTGATYRATQVLHVEYGRNARWIARQIADRPDCRNMPPLGVKAPLP